MSTINKPVERTLLITGGTGSLGKKICEYLLLNPVVHPFKKIIVYSRDEQKQEAMENELSFIVGSHAHACMEHDETMRYFIGDIRDKDRLALALKDVTDVIHCAALKIVPKIEYNPFEAMKTNVIGTQNLIDVVTSSKNNVFKVTAVSTDKAVHPINAYGASKLMMEKLILAANNINGLYGAQFKVVRYGNVTGSRGSVVPLFLNQYANKVPFTITDPNMTRFWITLDDAVKFVLGSHLGKDWYNPCEWVNIDDSKLLVPDMKSYNIMDILAAMFGKNVCYQFIGKRAGEKLHEHLYTDEEFKQYDITAPQTSDKAERMSIKELRTKLKALGFHKP